ncbi:MAG: Ig-like domain-containing protein, partial [Bacteroidales bacterium]|nr:Ig-like domain-containing protein [Bacteroidales bacterium]
TYESSNTSVATVDASGNVTPIAEGTATITASVAATGKYLAGSATCTVTVESATSTKVTYTLTPTGFTESETTGKTVTDSDNVLTFTAYKGGAGTAPGFYSNCIRLYQGSSTTPGGYLTITAKDGYKILSVTVTSGSTYASTTVKTSVDGGSTLSDASTLAKDSSITLENLSTSSYSIYCCGTTSKTRLDIASIKVTYDVQ